MQRIKVLWLRRDHTTPQPEQPFPRTFQAQPSRRRDQMSQTNVCVDGFNLFYGALKDSPYR